jgi:hypothetical protein
MMKRFLKRAFLGSVPAALTALVLGVPTAAPTLGLQNVNLSCNDSTNLALALDAASVTQLADAVSAINLVPAGDPALACSLTQSTTLTSSSSRTFSSRTFSSTASPNAAGGNPNTDYAVGGGRATLFGCFVGSTTLIPQETNFALNARVDAASNGSAGTGTFNVTIPTSQAAGCDPPDNREGHFNGKIDCVNVISPSMAQATFEITKADGSLASFQGLELRVDVLDSGMPGGTGDLIRLRVPFNGPCDFSTQPYSATRPVDNGNISIHQAS